MEKKLPLYYYRRYENTKYISPAAAINIFTLFNSFQEFNTSSSGYLK